MNNKIELTKIEAIKKLLDDCNINVENIGNKVKLLFYFYKSILKRGLDKKIEQGIYTGKWPFF